MSAYERLLDALNSHVVRSNGTKAQALCPAHDDTSPSLSITATEGQALVYCHAGCETVDVLAELELGMTDLFDTPRGVDYRYENGRTVHRTPDKRFSQHGTENPPELYRLSKVRAAVAAGRTVFVVEGEKDVHALETLGVTATCAPMGAGKWSKVDPSPLYGAAKVVIIADRDRAGAQHTSDVYVSLKDQVGKLEVKQARRGKHAADHIAADLGVDDFAPVDEPVGDDADPDSWSPVDLTPYLDGKITRPEPSVGLKRSDGLQLLYPGREHAVIGEMESAKSWFACGSCAEELTNGNPVLYIHFEEADPGDTIERLLALGVPKATIPARFTFVGPDQPATPEKLARLLARRPTLVVLDGVNEAMSLHGWKVREEDGAATFRRLLVKPCTAAGAATLAADHVVKDKERRGRDALGSVHKGNGLTGALILLENVEPFGRGLRGRSHLFVTKDRPGHLRRNGRPSGIPGKTHLGELVVDDTRALHSYLDLTFWAPNDHATEQPAEQSDTDEAAVLQAVADLAAGGKPANIRTLRVALKGRMRKDRIEDALTGLTLDDRLTETAGPNRARLFGVAGDQLLS